MPPISTGLKFLYIASYKIETIIVLLIPNILWPIFVLQKYT